jgi:hypothetical protein
MVEKEIPFLGLCRLKRKESQWIGIIVRVYNFWKFWELGYV